MNLSVDYLILTWKDKTLNMKINCVREMDAQLSSLQLAVVTMTSQALSNMSRIMNHTNRKLSVNGMAKLGQNFC